MTHLTRLFYNGGKLLLSLWRDFLNVEFLWKILIAASNSLQNIQCGTKHFVENYFESFLQCVCGPSDFRRHNTYFLILQMHEHCSRVNDVIIHFFLNCYFVEIKINKRFCSFNCTILCRAVSCLQLRSYLH